jgi:hypothetical protein
VAEPEPVHPGIDLQMKADRRAVPCCGGLHGARGRWRGDRRRQREFEDAVEIADAERAEHENRHAHARLPQDDPFLDIRARQHRRSRVLERQSNARRAMTVGVCFHHRDDAGRSPPRFTRKVSLDRGEIAAQRIEVNTGDGASNHSWNETGFNFRLVLPEMKPGLISD